MADGTRSAADEPRGSGPLADAVPETGRPIDDPVLADRANPRWDDRSTGEPEPVAQSLANADGSPNVMPPQQTPDDALAALGDRPGDDVDGTEQDQAARPLTPDGVGRDTIREGRGGGAANPALAEGGDSG